MRPGPVPLGENATDSVRPIVQEEAPVALAYVSEAQIGQQRIGLLSGRLQLEAGVDEDGSLGAPEEVVERLSVPQGRDRDDDFGMRLCERDGLIGQHRGALAERDVNAGPGRGTLGEFDRQRYKGFTSVRPPCQVRKVLPGYGFEPDRLPDPARAVVPDDVALLRPVLLAAGLREIVRIVLDADDDLESARRIRDLCGERGMPALVLGDVLAVHPDVGPVVDCSEVEQQAAAREMSRGGDLLSTYRAAVPHDAMEAGIADARRLRLRGERHGDRPRKRLGA
jgi:hypothetical protein